MSPLTEMTNFFLHSTLFSLYSSQVFAHHWSWVDIFPSGSGEKDGGGGGGGGGMTGASSSCHRDLSTTLPSVRWCVYLPRAEVATWPRLDQIRQLIEGEVAVNTDPLRSYSATPPHPPLHSASFRVWWLAQSLVKYFHPAPAGAEQHSIQAGHCRVGGFEASSLPQQGVQLCYCHAAHVAPLKSPGTAAWPDGPACRCHKDGI